MPLNITEIRIRRTLLRLLPSGVIRWAGALQFRYPAIKPLIAWGARGVMNGESEIKHGVGRGLKFDPSGSNPGYALGTTELDEQETLAAHLKEGSVLYDVGANVGFFAVIGARLVGPRGHVYAFEPYPASAAAVRKNAMRNAFEHVTVMECAISDGQREAEFGVGFEMSTNYRMTSGQVCGPTIRVKVESIDGLLLAKRLRPPGVVMIDAEGEEARVLAGMAETIRLHRPVILCEVHWLGKSFLETVSEYVEPYGYWVRQFDGSALPGEAVRYHALMVPVG